MHKLQSTRAAFSFINNAFATGAAAAFVSTPLSHCLSLSSSLFSPWAAFRVRFVFI